MIYSPLRVPVGKKLFTCNLNIYRNTFYQTLNRAKVEYKKMIKGQLEGLVLKPPVTIIYTYYPPDKRVSDLGNVLPIHAKFFEDTLVESGCLKDDNYKFINQTIYRFGAIDKGNPRVEIEIRSTDEIRIET
jgi:Holliday junction resolvase RusA-like endonuclease